MSKSTTTDAAPAVAGRVTSADGTTIAYERIGTGPALVLVDGAMCYRDLGPARDVARQLQDRYTVYTYDRRGRGDSGDTQQYSPEREVEDLAAVIAATGETPFVMGQSSGAGLALEAAAAGVPMRALVTYEAPYVGIRDGRDYVGDLRRLLDEGKNGKAVDYFMVKMVAGPWFMPLMMRMMRKNWAKLLTVAPTLLNDALLMGRFEVPVDRLSAIEVPTLALVGGKAAPEMLAAQQTIARAVPGAEHQVLEGQTHMVSPAALDAAAHSFFQRKAA